MEVTIEPSWKTALSGEFQQDYFQQLSAEVRADYLLNDPPIYPEAPLVFNAFARTPFTAVRVVILGQDPYHGPGQAMGLSFSVPDGVTIPPSLRNIYKEIVGDLGDQANLSAQTSGDLTRWTDQGVLLLNATLTVAHQSPGSHQGRGWETFTDAVIKKISDDREHVVFLLWGAYAGKKSVLIDGKKHLILKAPHPSPLSAHRGFFGCKHFSQTNQYLKTNDSTPIEW